MTVDEYLTHNEELWQSHHRLLSNRSKNITASPLAYPFTALWTEVIHAETGVHITAQSGRSPQPSRSIKCCRRLKVSLAALPSMRMLL